MRTDTTARLGTGTAARAMASAVAVALALATLLLGQATASADEHDDVELLPEPPVHDEVALDPVAATCAPVLLTATPEQSSGTAAAVAITAQAVDADVEGWLRVSWEAQPGAQLSAITVHTGTGSFTFADQIDHGTLDEVLELTFCGTYEAPVEEPEPEVDEGDAPGGTSGGSNGGSAGGPGSGSTGTATGGGSSPGSSTSTSTPPPDADDEADELPAVVEVPTPPAPTATDAAGEAEVVGDAVDDDVEVLGVQLTREPDAAGGIGAGWIATIVALLLAGLGTAVWLIRGGALPFGGAR